MSRLTRQEQIEKLREQFEDELITKAVLLISSKRMRNNKETIRDFLEREAPSGLIKSRVQSDNIINIIQQTVLINKMSSEAHATLNMDEFSILSHMFDKKKKGVESCLSYSKKDTHTRDLIRYKGRLERLVEKRGICNVCMEHNIAYIPIRGDGNCFFRSVCYAMNGNDNDHSQFRAIACDYLEQHMSDLLVPFGRQESEYKIEVDKLKRDGVFYTDMMDILVSQAHLIYDRNIIIYQCTISPVDQSRFADLLPHPIIPDKDTIRLHRVGCHYNAFYRFNEFEMVMLENPDRLSQIFPRTSSSSINPRWLNKYFKYMFPLGLSPSERMRLDSHKIYRSLYPQAVRIVCENIDKLSTPLYSRFIANFHSRTRELLNLDVYDRIITRQSSEEEATIRDLKYRISSPSSVKRNRTITSPPSLNREELDIQRAIEESLKTDPSVSKKVHFDQVQEVYYFDSDSDKRVMTQTRPIRPFRSPSRTSRSSRSPSRSPSRGSPPDIYRSQSPYPYSSPSRGYSDIYRSQSPYPYSSPSRGYSDIYRSPSPSPNRSPFSRFSRGGDTYRSPIPSPIPSPSRSPFSRFSRGYSDIRSPSPYPYSSPKYQETVSSRPDEIPIIPIKYTRTTTTTDTSKDIAEQFSERMQQYWPTVQTDLDELILNSRYQKKTHYTHLFLPIFPFFTEGNTRPEFPYLYDYDEVTRCLLLPGFLKYFDIFIRTLVYAIQRHTVRGNVPKDLLYTYFRQPDYSKLRISVCFMFKPCLEYMMRMNSLYQRLQTNKDNYKRLYESLCELDRYIRDSPHYEDVHSHYKQAVQKFLRVNKWLA